MRRNPEYMQRRKEVAEHPFGTVKWYDGAHYFLCRGKEKVSAEMALSFLTYNLRRAINLLGVGALVAHFRAEIITTRQTGGQTTDKPTILGWWVLKYKEVERRRSS